ncbi:MAG: NINE protein [Akkermansiaceae bacterium]
MTRRSCLVAYILWLFLGLLGAHRLYFEHWVWAVVYFFTGGFFLIGWLVDLFLIPSYVRAYNERLARVGL